MKNAIDRFFLDQWRSREANDEQHPSYLWLIISNGMLTSNALKWSYFERPFLLTKQEILDTDYLCVILKTCQTRRVQLSL